MTDAAIMYFIVTLTDADELVHCNFVEAGIMTVHEFQQKPNGSSNTE